MLKILHLVVACTGACLAQSGQLGSDGEIAGVLTGDDGTAIVGGGLNLQRIAPYPVGRSATDQWFTKSGSGGAFHFDGLYGGQYQLCAQVAGSAWLNPCEWGLQPQKVALSVAQPSVSVTMVMKKGAVVPIRIDDPGQYLSQNEGRCRAHIC